MLRVSSSSVLYLYLYSSRWFSDWLSVVDCLTTQKVTAGGCKYVYTCSSTKCFLCTEIFQINKFAIQGFYKIVLLYLYTKFFIDMIILYYPMCLNSEQDFTDSPHEIFHETSLGPDALFITTKKFLFNYKVAFQYIYVKLILLNYSYPGFKRCSLNSTKKIPRFNSLLKCPLLCCQVF